MLARNLISCFSFYPFSFLQYKELSENHPDVVFLKVDVDENPDTAAKYSVSAMPTFVFIKGGDVVDRLMGANPARLEEMINDLK
jgi:thioredoxin 1